MIGNWFRLVGVFAFVVAITAVLLFLWQSQLVAPPPSSPAVFSDARALATLSRLLDDQRPHPVGSAANAVVRDRIIAELTSAGYAPQVQAALQCERGGRNAGCTAVENIVAVHGGSGSGKAVLVSAHYDSVPAGPGASDDGAGVAVVLELARAFSGKSTRNDIVFLITDGEETGLRGAHAFAEHHPLIGHVGVVVNFEARGASGPAMMFETGPGNARLVDLFTRAVAQPSANSVTYEVYKLLPNDTDFSVYRRRGLSGFNFAFSNSASLYHSARDSVQYLDPRSLRHMGGQAMEVVGTLADTDLANIASERNASFFDVFGLVTVAWPEAINLPISLLALVALVGLVIAYRDALPRHAWAGAIAASIAVPALLFAAGWLLSYPLGVWPGVHPLDHPHPWPGRIAIMAAGMLVPLLVAAALRGRVDARALLLVNWTLLALVAVATAIGVTGVSYTLLWPVAGVAVAGWTETLLCREPEKSLRRTGLLGYSLVAFSLLGFFLALEMVLGFDLSQYRILVLVPLSLALVPVFAADSGERSLPTWLVTTLCAMVATGAALVAWHAPAYAANHPRGLNITYYDDRAGNPRWLAGFVGAQDRDYLATHGFAREEDYLQFGVLRARGNFRAATALGLAAPSFATTETTTRDGTTVVHGTLRSGRGGFLLGAGFAPGSGIRSLRLDGQEVIGPESLPGKDPVLARFWGLGTRDLPVEIAFDAGAAPKLVLFERSLLPDSAEGRALQAARPADAAPAYSGDSALVIVTVDLRS